MSLQTMLVREDEGNSSRAESEPVTLLGLVLGALDDLAPTPAQWLSSFFVDEEGLLDQAEEALSEDDSLDEEDDYDEALFAWVSEHYSWYDATNLAPAARAIRERLAERRDEYPRGIEAIRGYARVDDVLTELDRLIAQAEEAAGDGVAVALCSV